MAVSASDALCQMNGGYLLGLQIEMADVAQGIGVGIGFIGRRFFVRGLFRKTNGKSPGENGENRYCQY
ncbi:MAG TPA: hypothetical protein VMW16_11425 [Sedimentisphaerales bacterium]|nr:hypothetical protein [Sedimentisphaerales bacterium]